ncbi:MAG: hypothetical protein ACFFCW_21750 [Candidatus Hodarchaeota archaeon]
MWRHSITLICIAVLLGGCSPKITVRIDSITDQVEPMREKKYVLYSAVKGISVDDLYFREHSGYFREILKQQGYREVQDRENADVAIYFDYGISGGKVIHHTYTRPVYATVGGETIDVTERHIDASGKTTSKTTRSVFIPPREYVVGITTERESYTVYTTHALLEAKAIKPEDQTQDGRTLWKTIITTTSQLDDLRRLMPMLAIASAPYLGTNTRGVQTVDLGENDPRVLEMKHLGF